MIRFDVRAENIKEIVARLKEIDPDLVKAFRRELKATGRDVASTVQSRINTIPPPLSNMQYGSARALRWAGAKATVRTDLSVRRRKSVSDLLWINVDSPKDSPGYIGSKYIK